MSTSNKLTIKDHLGYSSGSIGDALIYTFINVFLMFFLTTVAHVPPGIAGTIAAVGTVWNALFNPIMGFLSDKVRTRMGRRRPLILAFSIPMTLFAALAFSALPLPSGIQPVFYGFMIMALWTCYTGYFVPYCALGAEYTANYDERTVLRLYASLANMIGALICMVTPTILVDFLVQEGMSRALAWSIAAGLIGLISTLSILVTFFASKQKDPPCDAGSEIDAESAATTADPSNSETEPTPSTQSRFSLTNIFREYFSVAKLRPIRYLIIASVTSLICYTLVMSDMVYFFTYNMGFGAGTISLCLILRAVAGLITLPIVGKCALAIDKRGTIILFYSMAAVVMIALRIVGVTGTVSMGVYIIGTMLCTCIYWDLMPSIYYDVCDYDILVSGKHRQGTIVSFQGLVEAVASGCGSLILGVLLQSAGFDGSKPAQTAHAMEWIFNCGTVVPIIFLLIACYAIYRYPITREKHSEILKEIVSKGL